MPGGILQLAAIGPQDVFLTGNPQITYFIAVYKRYSNFSIECVQQLFTGNTDFGKKVYCKLDRVGDLMSEIYLHVRLPTLTSNKHPDKSIYWVNSIGHVLIKYIDIEIGQTVIDRQYGIWMEIWSELTMVKGKESAFNEMIGKYDKMNGQISETHGGSMELYIPLYFWFCRNIGLALPLIALQHHDVVINMSIRDLDELWICDDLDVEPDLTSIVECSLYIDYIFLGDEERRRFANTEHEYLIEQLQISSTSLDASIQTDNQMRQTARGDKTLIDVKFNHPVKEFIWIIQNSLILEISDDGRHLGNDWFNFGNVVDRNKQHDPMFNGKFIVDGKDRMALRSGKYFRLVQPYQRHTSVPEDTFIYVYSFALNPEEHQPSGTFNFSCVDSCLFEVTLNAGITRPVLQMFATNYNVLRIMGGMAGVAFSS